MGARISIGMRGVVLMIFGALMGGTHDGHAAVGVPAQRIALIIANYDYPGPHDRLSGPKLDADILKRSLRNLGFVGINGEAEPTLQANRNKAEMTQSILAFKKDLEAAGPLAVGLLYYAGHGGADQEGRDNYLIPIDVPNVASADLVAGGVAVRGFITRTLRGLESHQKVMVIIDACRTTGEATSPSDSSHLSFRAPDAMQPQGMLMALSTGEGQSAADTGAYAEILAAKLNTPGLNVAEVFEEVKLGVARQTGNKQIPVYQSQMTESLCLAGCGVQMTVDPLTAVMNAIKLRAAADTGQIAAIEQLATSGKSLTGLDLQGVFFAGADIPGIALQGAELGLTDFSQATLNGAKLSSAHFKFANLNGMKATEADATSATFFFVKGEGADFSGIRAEQSNWEAASLRGAHFRGAHLQGVSFLNADLRDADFTGADLRGTYFIGADVIGAHFDKAQFDNTDFSGAIGAAEQFSAQQKAQMCGTDLTRDIYRYTVREYDPTAAQHYRDFIDSWIPMRSGLRYLAPCAVRTRIATGNAPIYVSRKYEQINEELTLTFPLDLLDSAGRRDRVTQTAKTLLANVSKDSSSGRVIEVPSAHSAELLKTLTRNVGDSALIGDPILDADAIFLIRARYQPQSISSEEWHSAAIRYADRDTTTPSPQNGPTNQWPKFFPVTTRPNELNDAHVEQFKKWTLERAKRFPLRMPIDLSSRSAREKMSNMQDEAFDRTHTPFETFLPLALFASEHPIQSPAFEQTGLQPTDMFRYEDAMVHSKKPLASYVIKIPRSMAAATRKELPAIRGSLEISNAHVYPGNAGNQLIIEGELSDVSIKYGDGTQIAAEK